MLNLELSKIFYQISELLEMQDVAFRPQAYNKAARILESLEEDVLEIHKKGGLKALEKLPGVGESIAEKIEEFIKTGKIKYYEKLKKTCPVDLENLTRVEGLGPKMIKVLYQKLKVRNLEDLEKAAKAGKIRNLERLGEKSEKNILRGIGFLKKSHGRVLLGMILPYVRQIERELKSLEETEQVAVAGSIRRMKETIGDIDILATSGNSAKVMDFFVSLPEVEEIYSKGPTRSSVRLKIGLDCDLRVVKKECLGAALQYFTGSKEHNIAVRKIAMDKGYKLNEYGLYKAKSEKLKTKNQWIQIAGKNEKEIYHKLGMDWMEPELRENTGEIEAAIGQFQGKPNGLPRPVEYNDIKGDLQMHSNWSDGSDSILDLAKAAKELGHQYILITDHTGELRIAGGLSERELLKYIAEIDKINKQVPGIKVLKGAEVNIKADGGLDISDSILSKLDIVLASIHSHFKMPKKEMTERICRAMQNPYVNIISHPTGRIINRREGYQIDLEKIFECAKRTNTALEINGYPARLDLADVNIRRAVEAGIKLTIGTDSHSKNQLHFIELAVAQARRGWAEKKDILNCLSWQELLKYFKK